MGFWTSLPSPYSGSIGGLKVIGFLLLVAVIAIGTPLYHLFTTGTASSTEIEIALFVLGLVILFFTASWYTVLGCISLFATVVIYFALNPDTSAPSYDLVKNVLWGFQLVGFVWVGVKHCRRNRVYCRNRVYGDSGKRAKRTDRGRVHTARPRRHSAHEHDHREVANTEKAPDHYHQVLGVQNGASTEELKQAHRDLVKVWHPDRFSADDQRPRRKAEAKLREINEAYAYITANAACGSPASDAHFVDAIDAIQYSPQ